MKKQDNSGSKRAGALPRTKNRRVIFGIIALLIPFFILGLFEGGLRLFGYGRDLGLFVESAERPGFLVMNPHASEKYFGDPENATTGNYEEFSKKKGAGTYRFFVLGESTTVGYPYFYNGSFHRWLQYRLQHSYPNLNFEIINVSLTAVNSYTVLGFGKEVIKYEPDAVMIYTGHNEYYGAMGVGSTNAIHGNRFLINTLLKLREFRLVQLFSRSWYGLKRLFAGNKKGQREGLMKRMAEGQRIPYDSEIYKQGISQFETNMDELLALLTKQNIPVFVSNLVSNEKDLKPFISEENSTDSAKNQYQQATLAYERGDTAKAKSLFIKAKELDLLRFRAPEAINETILKLTRKYPGSHLVDTKSLYEKNSPGGIVGKTTLLEHVHPNLFGYALLSDAFYRSFSRVMKLNSKADNPHEMSFTQLRSQMPITAVDSLKGAYEILLLKEGWPFNEVIPEKDKFGVSYEAALAGRLVMKKITWGDAMLSLLEYYQKENKLEPAVKVCEALALEHPYDPAFLIQSGKIKMQLGANEGAIFDLKRAFTLENTFETARDIFITMLKQDRSEEAVAYLRYAAEHNNTTFSLNELVSFVDKINVLKANLKKDTANADTSVEIAAAYLEFANIEVAEKYVNASLKLKAGDLKALKLKRQIADIKSKM
ncbi:hypothetical protein [Dyadobacter sp. LHD-138]|uniref:hypothetical protein n=1 Tax=Dyadobacter sp. LHD-138 TaxID=3071413 RepID=UPI0027E05F8F|nr:hypothetical protein [Dyadobacter sp. LHD-138]MDQ6479371.1 hypothetical protein [Dyadobacter sp. LHD-138]